MKYGLVSEKQGGTLSKINISCSLRGLEGAKSNSIQDAPSL